MKVELSEDEMITLCAVCNLLATICPVKYRVWNVFPIEEKLNGIIEEINAPAVECNE